MRFSGGMWHLLIQPTAALLISPFMLYQHNFETLYQHNMGNSKDFVYAPGLKALTLTLYLSSELDGRELCLSVDSQAQHKP